MGKVSHFVKIQLIGWFPPLPCQLTVSDKYPHKQPGTSLRQVEMHLAVVQHQETLRVS